jgi:NAD(P)-dependent dehydrogenase (short-subunit alcohol dehydrogenase family)
MSIDLAEEDNVARLFDAASAYLGGVDVAVINAARGAEGLTDMSEAELNRILVRFGARDSKID